MKTRFKRLSALMLSAAMVFSVFPALNLHAEETEAASEYKADMKTHEEIFDGKTDQYKGRTVILHSNDVHGAIDGYAQIAELEDDFEEAGAEVITMDAGDYSQGNPYVSYSKGADAVALMNAAGYEYSTLGNHEFDYGYEQLKSNLGSATFKVLCADVLEGDKTIYDADEVYTTKTGVKIGIFGMETPETQSKANPVLIKGLTFISNTGGKTDLYDCAKKEVQTLKDQGADIIISLAHLGMDEESKLDGHRSIDMYNNVSGIDMILDGHSHSVMTEGPDKEPIQSTGKYLPNIGVVVIDDAAKKIGEHYLIATEGLDKDPEVEAAVQVVKDKVDTALGDVIGTSKVTFASEKTENRCYETNTGDLITDAMVWEILKDKDSLNVSEDKVIAVINGGGIRAGLSIGDFGRKDIQAILPFGNTLNVVYVTGSQLLEALEASTFMTPESVGGYPQTKGIKFTIDTTKAYDQGAPYDSTYYSPKTIQRVTIESINGKAFDANETYAVITNDFCAAGGDTYAAFAASTNIMDTGFPVDEVVSSYILDELGGILSAKRYGAPRGDVTINPAPVETVYEIGALDGASLKKLTTKKGKLTVSWEKTAEEIDGFQVAYSTKKSFSKKATKTINVSFTKTKKTVKGLKSKKKYYVRIRTYANVGGQDIYSDWSKVKNIKIK